MEVSNVDERLLSAEITCYLIVPEDTGCHV